jgi:hypothetical protein
MISVAISKPRPVLANVRQNPAGPSKFWVMQHRPRPRPVELRFNDSEDPMRNSRRFDDDDDYETILDFDGKPARILRDGHSVRVSLTMRDALRRNDAEASRVAEAVATTRATMRGTGTAADPYILGQWPVADAYAANKPGYRYADASSTSYSTGDPGPGDGAGSDPWDRPRRRRRRTQAREPLGRESGSTVTEEENDSLAGLSASERARAEWILSDAQAWRTTDAQVTDLSPLRDVPPPGGLFPPSAEGQVCDLTGARGVVTKGTDGRCYCRPLPAIGTTRADSAAGDAAPPRTMSQEDATRINDQAWREAVADLHNAWKG